MLAEKLGMTKSQLLDSISSEEITEWLFEFRIREEERKREEAKNKPRKKGR